MKYSIDQSQIKDNTHPTQRYEVSVTLDAPEPVTTMTGGVAYIPVNVECVPKLPLEGARQVPNTSRDFNMTSTDGGRTWKGYFYRDMIEDEDYFGLGVCRWDIESVGAGFKAHGDGFGVSLSLQDLNSPRRYTSYFSRKEFFNKAINNGIAREWRAAYEESSAEVAKDPSAYFPMTIEVKEVDP